MKYILKSILTATFTLLLAFSLSLDAEAQEVQQETAQPDGETVMDVVTSNPDNSVFAELLAESDMQEILSAEGPFTVLAPTDEALEEAGITAEQLQENPEQIQEIIRPHLYQGDMDSERVESALNVEVEDGDHEAANGVVHVVDEVVQQ